MIEKIEKPALSALWPNKNGMNVVLDLGANIECDDNNLLVVASVWVSLALDREETRDEWNALQCTCQDDK